jgi:hypothetical protein
MGEMIEKCAEAIWQAEWTRAGNGGKRRVAWSENSDETHEKYRYLAAAVIDALMTPDTLMVAVGAREYKFPSTEESFSHERATAVYRAMLSKAKSG